MEGQVSKCISESEVQGVSLDGRFHFESRIRIQMKSTTRKVDDIT